MLHKAAQLQITIYPLAFLDILEKVLTTRSQPALYILYVDVFYHQTLKMMLQLDYQIGPIVKNFTMLLQYHPISRMIL